MFRHLQYINFSSKQDCQQADQAIHFIKKIRKYDAEHFTMCYLQSTASKKHFETKHPEFQRSDANFFMKKEQQLKNKLAQLMFHQGEPHMV